jgi:hypothetical protein
MKSPTPIGSSAEKAFIIYGIYRPVDIISKVSKVSRLVNKHFDLFFQASEYEKQRQKHGISCQYKLFEEETLYMFGSK